MQSKLISMIFIALIIFPFEVAGAGDGVRIECSRVSDDLYCLYGRGGNIGALSTDEGLLVVDSQFKETADSVMKALGSLPRGEKIKYLINTHYHGDHTSGNEIIGRGAEIIMHPQCKLALEEMYREKGLESGYLDRVRIWEEGMKISIGGETVSLLYFGNGHTSGDLVVVFEKARAVHAGDLFFNGRPPYIDVQNGADTENWISAIETLCEKYPDYTFIPGHGRTAGAKSFLKLAGYLKILRAEVARAIEGGKSREEAMEDISLDKCSFLEGYDSSRRDLVKRNIGWVYDEMAGGGK